MSKGNGDPGYLKAAAGVSDAWRTAKLGDVCEIQLGKMLSPISKTGKNSRPYLRNANVQWNRFDLSDVSQMDFTEEEEQKFRLTRGDVLVCEGGEPGRAAVWDDQLTPCYYQKALHRLRPISNHVDPRFIMYRLWLGGLQGEFINSHAKTTIAHLPAVRLAQLRIKLPPLFEQKRIVDTLNEQIESIVRARKAADEQLAAAKTLPVAYLREVFGSEETYQWPKTKLGEILTLRKDVIHPHDNPTGDAIFVGLEHIESLTGRRIGSLSVKKEALTGRKPQFYKGDLVYGYLRPYLNKLWIGEFDGLCSVDQYVYSVDKSRANTEFVAWFMRSPVYLKRAPIDTTPGQLPRIRTEEVATVEIGLPDLKEQQEVASAMNVKIATSLEMISSIKARLTSLDSLTTALLGRAFNGHI